MKLKDFLEKNNLTARQFSQAVDCHYDTIKNYLVERRHPNETMMKRISQYTKGLVTDIDFKTNKSRVFCKCCGRLMLKKMS